MSALIDAAKGALPKIKVVGIGHAGVNALNNMIRSNLKEVEFIVVSADLQVLDTSDAKTKLRIGKQITKGVGTGSEPQTGREAALEDRERIRELLKDSDMVYIIAGMGGGTGTGAAPVIAEIARGFGALTVAVVTKPFFDEGEVRLSNATLGIKELNQFVDTTIIIPMDNIRLVVEKDPPSLKIFEVAYDALRDAVQGITDLILVPGLINLDFADVKTIMQCSGKAFMGVGRGTGEQGHIEAAKKAISAPLSEETSIYGAKRILINITGGSELSLDAVQGASELVFDSAHDDADIIFGAVIDPNYSDQVTVTVIATGFEDKKETTMPKMNRPMYLYDERHVYYESVEKDAICGTITSTKNNERILQSEPYHRSLESHLEPNYIISFDKESLRLPPSLKKIRKPI
ncbi:MAG: cell division protein FtsZ [Nitrospirae bacterium]|nr:cell division protein FtsZ [Nitrospirota bacterium]